MSHSTSVSQPWRALAALGALLLALQVASCGGGGVGSGGTGAPQASASGTVTGFGSVFVDGVRYDESDADVLVEIGPGVVANAALALGQSVEVQIASEGVATSIAVEARLLAPVESVAADGSFSVLGQTVQINADADAGPVTLFGGGVGGGAPLAAGDVVEVHGFARSDGGSERVQATRIERRSAMPPQWRIVGRVADLRSAGARRLFSIGALTVDHTDAALLPAGATLADGQTVLVFGNSAPGDARRLVATQVRVFERVSTPALDAQIGGSIDQLDTDSFRVNGVLVEFAGATVTPASRTLANGQYVQVRGAFRARDGALLASHVRIRSAADEPPVELAGTLFDVDAAAQTARLRDTRISFADARLQGCPDGLADGRYVELRGTAGSDGVSAETIRCRNEPNNATIERRGVASAVDAAGRTFTLTPSAGEPISVRIDKRTHFRGIDEASLAGARVRVEGRFTGNMLRASSITAL